MKKVVKFIKRINKLYKQHYPTSVFIVIGIAVIASLWQLPQLYFWVDDWDLFLKVVHPNLSVWGSGEGFFGSGPYRYFHTTFLILYPFFHLNPSPYYIFGVFLYFLTALSVYLLITELSGKRYLALSAALVFSFAGIVGAQATEHLQHLYAMMGVTLFTCLSIWSLIHHFKTGRIRWYLLSILLVAFASEYFILRAHGLFFLVVFSIVLFYKWKKSIKNVFTILIKTIPFFLIFNHQYFGVYGSGQSSSLGGFIENISSIQALGYFINFPGVFSNIIVPDTVTKSLYQLLLDHFSLTNPDLIVLSVFTVFEIWLIRKERLRFFASIFIVLINIAFVFFSRWSIKQSLLWSYTDFENFTAVFGESLMFSTLLLVFVSWRKRNIQSRLILFGVLWFFAEYIGYFIASPAYSFLGTTQRYLAPSLVATSLIISGVVFLSGVKRKNIIIFSSILVAFVFLINIELATIVGTVSIPSKQFYSDIRTQVKSLPKNPIILFDTFRTPRIIGMSGNTYPSTGLALFYNAPDRIPAVSSFSDLLEMIKNGKITTKNILTFYLDENGRVKDTTQSVRKRLQNPQNPYAIKSQSFKSTTTITRLDSSSLAGPLIYQSKDGSLGVNPTLTAQVNQTSASPLLLTINVSATPQDFNSTAFPYTDITQKTVGSVTKEDLADFSIEDNSSCQNRSLYLQMQAQHDDFLKSAKVIATTDWRGNVVANIHDGNNITSWDANALAWDSIHREKILIDLGSYRKVGRLIWINHFSRSTPSTYSIFTSDNQEEWKEVKKIVNGPSRKEDEVVIDVFPEDVLARYVKLDISKTFSNQAPSIREIWVDSIRQEAVDWNSANEIVNQPFSCPVSSLEEVNGILNTLGNKINAKLWWVTNATALYNPENILDWNIIPDGEIHTYEFYLPAQGTKLEEIKMSDFQIPLNMEIQSASIKSLTFDEIDALGKIPSSK